MNKYQKYIFRKFEYARNFIFSESVPKKNECDGSLKCYGSFDEKEDVYHIKQDEDINKTKYILTIDTKKNECAPFKAIYTRKANKWTKVECTEGRYIITADFSGRIDAVKFEFLNGIADDYVLKLTYTEADKDQYYAKVAQAKKEELLKAANIRVSAGSNLVNVYFQPCCDKYDHTEVRLFVPKDIAATGRSSKSVNNPSDWSLIKKCSVPADDFFASVSGLAYGKYAVTLKQYDKQDNPLTESDYIPFSILMPPEPDYGCVNVI